MKKLTLLILSILFTYTVFADNKENVVTLQPEKGSTTSFSESNLPLNYQQFKHRLLSRDAEKSAMPPAANYRGGDDYTVLYVAGGIAVVTTGFILLNGNNKYTGEFGPANRGMLIGGSISSAVLVTKYFIDKYR